MVELLLLLEKYWLSQWNNLRQNCLTRADRKLSKWGFQPAGLVDLSGSHNLSENQSKLHLSLFVILWSCWTGISWLEGQIKKALSNISQSDNSFWLKWNLFSNFYVSLFLTSHFTPDYFPNKFKKIEEGFLFSKPMMEIDRFAGREMSHVNSIKSLTTKQYKNQTECSLCWTK